jgi:hypothetical protein
VSEHFERDGVEITSGKDFGKLAEQVDERSGAIFDPATGRVVQVAREIYEKDLEQSAREPFGCSGFVRLILVQMLARYGGAAANWDGRRVMIDAGPRLALQVLAGVSEYGWVPALSLWIHVTDLKREDVAFRTAGIEPLQDLGLSRCRPPIRRRAGRSPRVGGLRQPGAELPGADGLGRPHSRRARDRAR